LTTFVVAGLEVEARIARRAGLSAVVASGKPERRDAVIARAIAAGATGLISFGIAGGLDPTLAPGTVLLPETVHTETGEVFATDVEWRRRLQAHIPGARSGAIYASAAVVSRVADKHSLFDRTRAAAVDMESGAVARAAAQAGIPFVVLRSIADPAHRSLPQAAIGGLSDEGRVAFGAVFGHLVRNLHHFPKLLYIAFDTRRALTAMDAIAAPAEGFHAVPAAT
jgi:hopanoid-associated phosphorylase